MKQNQTVTLPVLEAKNPRSVRGVKRRTNCSRVFLNP